MVSDPKIVQYVEELDLLIIRDGEKLYHIDGNVIAGMFKAYMEGHGIDYDICEGCECAKPETACESCQNQNTCKDAPIPSNYDCLGYKPEEGADDLISKQALLYALDDTELTDDGGVDINDLEDLIKRMPTIEAVPFEDYQSMEQTVHKLTQALAEAELKHGRWITVSDGYGNGVATASICECSLCKDTIWVYKNDKRKWKFCPNCGAKMDGGENEL